MALKILLSCDFASDLPCVRPDLNDFGYILIILHVFFLIDLNKIIKRVIVVIMCWLSYTANGILS